MMGAIGLVIATACTTVNAPEIDAPSTVAPGDSVAITISPDGEGITNTVWWSVDGEYQAALDDLIVVDPLDASLMASPPQAGSAWTVVVQQVQNGLESGPAWRTIRIVEDDTGVP